MEGQGKARIPSPPPGLDSIISSSHRTVILGDPGGGKSTLSLKLTYDIARDGFSASAARIPFLVILRDYTRDFEAGNTTMVQYLEALCRSPYNMDPPAGFVEHALTSGRAFVIFDGLDELIDTSLRRKVVELVESFAYRYPMTPILVTTRKVGYEEAPLDSSLFHAVQLGQLDDDGVKSYADKWFMLDNTLEKNRRVELSASFFQDSRFVADLTQNPLMLSLMCGIYASENYIPANRPEVYKKCTELLFDKWDKQRGIVTPLPFDAHVKHAINALAYAIYSDSKHRSGLTRDRLIRFVKDFLLAKRFEDDDEAENAATQFVEFCTGRAWVLSNVGSDESQELYGFTHRTFLEYFAANQLVRLNPTAEQLFGKLLDKISHAEWDVVSQLAVQIIGNNTEDGMDDFLERVIGAAEKSPIEEKANLLAFAGRALGFAVPKPALVRQICQASVAMAMGNPSEGTPFRRDRYAQLRGVRAVLHANSENLPSVAKYLRASLRVEDSSIEAREVCLALALSISLVPYAGIDDASYMTSKAREYWNDFEAENFDEFAAEMDSLAEHRGWAALYAAVAGRRPIRHVIDAYGPEVLFQFHSGPLTLRPPVVMRIDPYSDVRSRSDWALDTCLSDLSVILPRCETPWFVSEYDYDPIGKLGRHAFGAFFGTLSDFPEEHRDAVILLAAAWIELGGGPRQAFDGRADGRIVLLMQKWNAARIGQRPVSHALRSIRSTKVSGRVVELLEAWVQGRLRFTRKPIPVAESAAAETQC
ncbi:NACHT domain-containing protein [Streptomyces sp. PCS3-D2]|uniref:NACHT domain-containing protein n=1 Tax=Streptomyces sp. PCS3-D2 TaxID=1460244 RepID=UPI00272D4E36|nr:NACHT domain-containing protein [Streptomyces sp. PCS3-D2]WKV73883.1 NACHT domain-containing protein [Streptomyces sp. PCS3-D2]